MEFTTKNFGASRTNPVKIIELTVTACNATIIEDVTDLSGHVDENLIIVLRDIANELEEQNTLLAE